LRESRTYRRFSAQQKTELVLASLPGHRTVAEICREPEMSEPRLRKRREQFLAAGSVRPSGKAERTEMYELRGQVRRRERALGRKTLELKISGELVRGWERTSVSLDPASWSLREGRRAPDRGRPAPRAAWAATS
jgi:transposase